MNLCSIRSRNILLVFCCLILKNVRLSCFRWGPTVDRGKMERASEEKRNKF